MNANTMTIVHLLRSAFRGEITRMKSVEERDQYFRKDQVWDRIKNRLEYIVEDIVASHEGAAPSMLTEERIRLVDEALVRDLDQTAPSSTSKQVFRPLWPMSIAQLRQQVQDNPPTQKNPAPLWKRPTGKSNQDEIRRAQSVHLDSIMRRIGVRVDYDTRRDPEDTATLLGMAWQRAAPEGFPPWPRKGGVYSETEALAIFTWIQSTWPVLREFKALCRRVDARIRRAGYSYKFLESSNYQIRHSFSHDLERPVLQYFPGAADKSPKDLWLAMLTWARDTFLPLVDALENFNVDVLKNRWDDPDAHIRALESNRLTRNSDVVHNVARYSYGLQHWASGEVWLKQLLGLSESGSHRTESGSYRMERYVSDYMGDTDDPAHKKFKLSTLLRLQTEHYKQIAEAERKEKETIQNHTGPVKIALKELIRSGKPFTAMNVERALPRGYVLKVTEQGYRNDTWKDYRILHLATNSVIYHTPYGDKPTVALAKMQKWAE